MPVNYVNITSWNIELAWWAIKFILYNPAMVFQKLLIYKDITLEIQYVILTHQIGIFDWVIYYTIMFYNIFKVPGSHFKKLIGIKKLCNRGV